jgi:hypothetical protein
VDDDGNALPGGQADPHYFVVEHGTQAVVYSANNLFPGWVPDKPTSGWIGWIDDALPGNYGVYTYRTTFMLSGGQAATATIKGAWIADQYGHIVLNGQPTGQSVPDSNWDKTIDPNGTPFAVTSGFVPGENALDFVVTMPDGYDGLCVLSIELAD